MRFASAVLAATIFLAAEMTGQTQHTLSVDGSSITLPPLTIASTSIETSVTYDSARGVYRYEYNIVAPSENRAAVLSVLIDVSGRVARPQTDPSLHENITRLGQDQPATTIPVGITVPASHAYWRGGVGQGGRAFFSTHRAFAGVLPGTSKGGFVLESKQPPGIRAVEMIPSTDLWEPILDALPEGELDPPADHRMYSVKTTVVAPSDPDFANLFNGGGQSPAEVNPFLRYVNPTETRTKLPQGTTSTWVIVAYGATTDPATFAATFEGADVRSRFHPVPGSVEAVLFTLQPGSNKLQLSISGATSSGKIARDSDSLTFLVP